MIKQIGTALLFALFYVGNSIPHETKPDLQRVCGLAGENGVIALQGDTISMFSDENIRVQEATGGDWKLQTKNSGGVSLRIAGSHWKRVQNHLPVSAAHGPLFCDRLNQVDISSTDSKLSRALPKGAKVKVVSHRDNSFLVVYSTSGAAVRYDVRVALLEPSSSGDYLLIQTDTATEDGSFCGMQSLDDGHYIILADEPSGSSDFLAVYVYNVANSPK